MSNECKLWLIALLVVLIIGLLCAIAHSEQYECFRHGKLSEDEVETITIFGHEYQLCLQCVERVYRNNQDAIERIIEKMKGVGNED